VQASVSETSIIEMSYAYISNLSLRNIYTDAKSTQHIIPVFLEEYQEEYLPTSLRARLSYPISISKWMETTDPTLLLNTPGLEQLRSLVYRLTGQAEVEKSPLR